MTAALASPAPRARRPLALKITLLLVGLAAGAVLIEIGFRLCWPPPPWFADFEQAGMYVATADGDVVLQPGYRGEVIGDTRTTVAIDALGLRGPEVAAKRVDERRLLVLGDSLVWGHGVEQHESLPARLHALLPAEGRTWTVGNAGVPGYGSKHMATHLARLDEPFGADAFVVCGHLGSDPQDDALPQRTVFAGVQLQGPWARLVKDSWRARLMCRSRAALCVESWLAAEHEELSLLRQVRFSPDEAATAAGFTQAKLHAGLFLDVIDPNTQWDPNAPPVVPRSLTMLEASLRKMREAAGPRLLVFVILPTVFHVNEERRVAELTKLGFEAKRFERGLAQRRWVDVARSVGVEVFDATPILTVEPDHAGLYLRDGGHFSVRGNDVVARWLAKELAPLLP